MYHFESVCVLLCTFVINLYNSNKIKGSGAKPWFREFGSSIANSQKDTKGHKRTLFMQNEKNFM
ncbi:hypothetical protein BpHYR1_012373 [Brachionus plicatilis]|uniref:Uncharacterized protein n=1 Tax=Brachionus plicatilis TaxID=10195 RepID=A0A3M7S201_BRAPC|nr:hypothetical protein BpHYR1_012373 [Brachionus plicatilis]